MALFASLSAHGRRFGAHLKTFWGASHYRRVPHQRKWVALGASLFFDDVYPSDDDAIESIKERIGAFDVSVHEYYDLRNTDRPVDAFSDQIASIAAQRMDAAYQVIPNATSQGFRLDR